MHLRRSAVVASVALVLFGCAVQEPGPTAPDRSAVESQISAAPSAAVVAAQPNWIELRSADGRTFMSSTVNPNGVYRDASQVLNPPDERPAWWAESGLPGTDTQQTVVVVGHNYSTRDAPFRSLSVTAPGDLVVMSTAAGVLNYRVETTGPLPKGSLLSENDLRTQVPGRLILANCDVREGEPTNDNFFVVAQLVP